MLENSLLFLITPRLCHWGHPVVVRKWRRRHKKVEYSNVESSLMNGAGGVSAQPKSSEKGELNERKWVSSFRLLFCVFCFYSKKSEIVPDNIPTDVQKWRQDDGSELIEKLSPFVSFAPLLTIEATNGILNEASTCLRTLWCAWTERQIFVILLWAEFPPWFQHYAT